MSQTTHSNSADVAQEGQLADLGEFKHVVSASVNSTNGAVPFGKFVRVRTQGDPPVVELPDATGEVTGITGLGIVVCDPAKQAVGDGLTTGAMCSVLRKGRVWVRSEDAVTAPAAAFVRFSASGSEILGSFRTDADTADAVALPGATFLTSCSAGGLTLLEFDAQK